MSRKAFLKHRKPNAAAKHVPHGHKFKMVDCPACHGKGKVRENVDDDSLTARMVKRV